MKKKIVAFILSTMMLTGCGTMSVGLGNYNFTKIHVDTHHYSGCLTIEKWYENDTGIEVKTKEAGSLYLSEGTYMLIENECPFCN